MDALGQFHYRIDGYRHVLEGLHDDVVVHLSAVAPDGAEHVAGAEIVSDEALTAAASAEAQRRPGETDVDYIERLRSLVTWSQRHLIEQIVARRQAPVLMRRKVERILAPSSTRTVQSDGKQVRQD